MPSTNLYMGIARVSRFTVSVSSTSCWNCSFSSMVATGNSPPYAVRFPPWKSKCVEALIFMGSRGPSPNPCLTGFFALRWPLSITIWVPPENWVVKSELHDLTGFIPGFSGSPNVSRLPRSSRRQILCIIQVTSKAEHKRFARVCTSSRGAIVVGGSLPARSADSHSVSGWCANLYASDGLVNLTSSPVAFIGGDEASVSNRKKGSIANSPWQTSSIHERATPGTPHQSYKPYNWSIAPIDLIGTG